ncbi:protein kinase domain-containing protein [Gordonia neofelifaecis]|uniref:non-specific serine/threonine protein kinase n=1 Tax=Gordonia neofelifaecis NRRL B-59395 TaxID=644548 RepID=F1YHK3_9ACTN|nr:protein kinase [Gordonia neofelifaecis]EGD55841.1 serine/threonine protein kinase-like protein [Gordonia neofelifaecis NRRL B-59395]
MTTPGDPLLGRVLERRYRIDAPIARGGMSSVYVGTDLRLGRRVAVKVMDARYVGDPLFLRRFEFEARAVAGLSHPGLVAVYDQSIDGEIAFLVMELVRGGSLRELLRERGPMPPHAVASVAIPMLGGLGTAHRAGLVHRDVKPENVLVSDTGDIKVADFGLVRAVAEAGVTSASVILGTAAYLSPEQVNSTDIDARSDVYSAGVMLFELLTGRQPFSGSTPLALAYQRLSYDVPAPGDLIEGVPPQIDEIVLRATERSRADRFRDGFDMQHALLDAADELDLPAFTVPAPSQASARVTSAISRPVREQATPAGPPQQTPRPVTAYDPDPLPPADDEWDDGAVPRDEPSDIPWNDDWSPEDELDVTHEADPAATSRGRALAFTWLTIVVLIAVAVGAVGWVVGGALA